jgi:hypothetical protein
MGRLQLSTRKNGETQDKFNAERCEKPLCNVSKSGLSAHSLLHMEIECSYRHICYRVEYAFTGLYVK